VSKQRESIYSAEVEVTKKPNPWASLNPNPGDVVANMTSKEQKCCDKFIIHPYRNSKKFVILYKRLVLNLL
jgi:hypothetical protein